MKPHPRFQEISNWFTTNGINHFLPLDGIFYRVAGPRYTTANDIISGTGSLYAAGRWNSQGIFRAVYASYEPETALFEANASSRHSGILSSEGFPKVVVSLKIKLRSCIDLTKIQSDSTLPFSISDLFSEDWRAISARREQATSQCLALAAYQAGVQAIIAPSNAATNGKNVIIFPEKLDSSDVLQVLNPELLTKLGSQS
jgi:RES domain-containing protein